MKLLLLCLFAALVAAANSLTCNCTAGTPGCGVDKTCTIEEGFCVLSASTSKLDGSEETTAIFRACQDSKAPFDMCTVGTLLISAKKGFFGGSTTKCCNDTELCNNGTLQVPDITTKSNWTCPSCFAVGSEPCNVSTMACDDSQNKCLNFTGNLTIRGSKPQNFTEKGCSNSDASILKPHMQVSFGDVTYIIETISMKNATDTAGQAPGSIVFAVLLPSLFGILLDKFLY